MGKRKHKVYDYDLIVIGSGAGGGVSAHIAEREGKKVAIVEADTIGGECPNFGCTPTKALIEAAHTLQVAKNSDQFGIKTGAVTYSLPAVENWVAQTVKNTGTTEGTEAFTSDGIAVIKGYAHFLSPHEISVNKKRLTAKKFVVATGTKQWVPPIEGLKEAGYVTYREAFGFEKLPKSMLVIGGGAIGCEFSYAMNQFGVKITQLEYGPRLLGREDKEVGELMGALFDRDGIKVHTGAEVFKVKKDGDKKVVYFKQGGDEHQVTVEEIFLASGKVPNTDLGLENAGVKYDKKGITVNPMMQTSAKHIYAVGDVTGPFGFTHMASYQARIASNNMWHREKVVVNYHAVPRAVYTQPEAAAVGMTEEEAYKKGINYRVNAVPTSIIGRANTSNDRSGFVKVITSHTGVLIGASVVAPRAGEMMQELAVAVQNGLKAEDVAATIHAFPTWSEAVRVACAGIKI